MAEKNAKGSQPVPIEPSLLDWAEYWYPISWKGVLAGGVITAVGACATIAFLLLQWRTTSIREEQSEIRTVALEAQTAQANASLGMAQADIAKANAQIAVANEGAAKANERTAELARETERLRQENLDFALAVSPRELVLDPPTTEALKRFQGLEVVISAVPGDEPQALAKQLTAILKSSGAIVGDVRSLPAAVPGVTITYEMGPIRDPNDPEKILEWRENKAQAEASGVLLKFLQEGKMDANVLRMPLARMPGTERRPGIHSDAISIEIGPKNRMFFLEARYPQVKEIRENIKRMIEESRRPAAAPQTPPTNPNK